MSASHQFSKLADNPLDRQARQKGGILRAYLLHEKSSEKVPESNAGPLGLPPASRARNEPGLLFYPTAIGGLIPPPPTLVLFHRPTTKKKKKKKKREKEKNVARLNIVFMELEIGTYTKILTDIMWVTHINYSPHYTRDEKGGTKR
jgi:hypothetical protein